MCNKYLLLMEKTAQGKRFRKKLKKRIRLKILFCLQKGLRIRYNQSMDSSITFIYSDLAGTQYSFKDGITRFLKKYGIEYDTFAKYVAEADEKANKGEISEIALAKKYKEIIPIEIPDAEFFEMWTDQLHPILPMHTLLQ